MSRIRSLADSVLRAGLFLLLGVGALPLSGCMVGPDYQRPSMELPGVWRGQPAPAETPAPADQELARWWTRFGDPQLTGLVDRALTANLNLRQAEARVRQARAARGVALSALGPTVDASGGYQRSRTTAGVEGDLYQAGFDAGWELDFFGGIRRAVEAAGADLAAAEEARRDVLVSLSAEVARDYINLRTFQQRLAVAGQNLKAQEHTAALVRQRYEAGFVSRLDLSNAEAQRATTAAQLPLFEISIRQTIHGLSVLLGREPVALLAELDPGAVVPAVPPAVPVGLPSDLLRRRPDIRRAEAAFHAATARIGVATADLFPRFTLSGALTFSDTHLGSLITWGERGWSFGPSVSWRLFESGRTLANIELRRALQEETGLAYQQAVLTALREVENALVAATREAEHRQALSAAVVANRQAVELAIKLYQAGEADFLPVLVAERALHAAEDALAQSSGRLATNLIALYKALGGGWDREQEEQAAGGQQP